MAEKRQRQRKKLIHLICRVEGKKVYDEKKEVNDDVKVTVGKVEMLIKEILGKIKVEKKDVI